MKILTIGDGFIASHLSYEIIKERVQFDSKQIEDMLDRHKPDVLINCCGYCGEKNIDSCEINKERTAMTNAVLPILLADACAKKSIHLIQISSGCVFYGMSPHTKFTQSKVAPSGVNVDEWLKDYSYKEADSIFIDTGWEEDDFALPISTYSRSKWAADLVLGNMSGASCLRIRMPISNKNSPRNFINKIRNYKQLIDVPNSITMVDDLVKCIDWVAKGSRTGIWHVVNPEPLSAARVMNEYKLHFPDHSFQVITEAELDKITVAKRSNCILSGSKLKNAGFEMTNSEEALKICMEKYVKGLNGKTL